jgi:hypothetical protein
MMGACHGRARSAPTIDWKRAHAETAALLMVEKNGATKLVCLPGHAQARQLFPGVALGRILDVSWNGGPLVAGWAASSDGAETRSGGELVLLAARDEPRRVAKNVRTAQFSRDGAMLAYEVDIGQRPGSDVGSAPATTYVLDLATGNVRELGALVDPLWESDGKHLRATRLRTLSEEHQTPALTWTSLRARWDRESGTTTIDGRGSAQIPAPAGEAVAWTGNQRSASGPNPCDVLLNRRGGVRHLAIGSLCRGIADDRSMRWSPDGRWLAFPHPGPIPGQRERGGFFVDVVSVEGGRYLALSALHDRTRPDQLAIVLAPGMVWFDWSPSGRFLAMNDGASELRVYDFEAPGIAFLGQGQKPMWSPGGGYLLVLSDGQGPAFVLPGVAPAARIDLGSVRDARWLPAQACDR